MAEKGLGMQTVLRSGTSATFPFSFAETSDGHLLLANGIDPMLKWNGQSNVAETAGVVAPVNPITLGGVGPGPIVGKFVAYVRFIDDHNNPSNLSPVSNIMDTGSDGFIDDISYNATNGIVTVTSPSHGLVGTQAVQIQGVQGLPIADGPFNVTVVDGDNFTVSGLTITSGLYEGGGSWRTGASQIIYQNVQVPSEAGTVRRQILRNLSGNLLSLYVDIDTTDLSSSTFTSTKTDSDLVRSIGIPMFYGKDNIPYANRYGLPPNHKSVLVNHKGRVYAAVDAVYSDGHVEPLNDSTLLQGVATDWRKTFIGRMVYVDGALFPATIVDVDETNQVITMDAPLQGNLKKFAKYKVRPAPCEKQLVYFSESALVDAWPIYNAISLPEDNDEITGLHSDGQYLHIFKSNHLYRLTFQGDPSDGAIYLEGRRGSINNRTWIYSDETIYAMDVIGIYKFDGQRFHNLSMPIQNLFQDDGTSIIAIDWNADKSLWHAAHDPARDTIRWFVNIIGQDSLQSAICYNYRTDRFWLEAYQSSISASSNATIGCRRSLVGTDARRILCLSQGVYDGIDGTGTVRGRVSFADQVSLTDSTASFEATEGAPVAIVEGTGSGQVRTIATVTQTQLEVLQPWDTIPDTTSIYQIGGIPWIWRSGWFRFGQHEESVSRDVEIAWRPTSMPTTLNIRLFFDHNVNPRVWALSDSKDGIRTVAGDPKIRVDLMTSRGWARQRMGGHAGHYAYGDTYESVEMSGVQGGSPVIISQLILNDIEG